MVLPASAGWWSKRAKHADKNKDGVVTKKEWQKEKAWERTKKSEVNTRWEEKADTNDDGMVSQRERYEWKEKQEELADINNDGVVDNKEKRLTWKYARSKVNTSLEKKYDTDGSGYLEPDEARVMLEDRYAVIQSNGKAVVNTPIEAEYDTDNNGIIDSDEAEELKDDLGLL